MPVEIDIEHVARLARLELTDDERARLREQLGVILEAAAKVSEVATDDVPPTLYHCQRNDHFMVVSEPLDEDGNCEAWREVPSGQMLVIEKRGRLDMAPFLPRI